MVIIMNDLFEQYAIKNPKLAFLLIVAILTLLVVIIQYLLSLIERKAILWTAKNLGWKKAKIYKVNAMVDGRYTGSKGPRYKVDYQDKKELWHTKYCSVSIVGVVWYDEYY